MSSEPASNVLLANEAEMYVQNLKPFALKDVGSHGWLKQHEYVEKLNIQSHINVSTQTEEFVMEALISFEKIPVLIHELIVIELWRQNVYPHLVKLNFAEKSTMVPYIVRYHEATLVSLLESVLYHKESCEAASDVILDLVDYCVRAVMYLHSRTPEDFKREAQLKGEGGSRSKEEMMEVTGQQQLDQQLATLPFEIAVKAVSILRYITDHINALPLSCMTRILNTHDVPSALVHLIVNPPWTRERDGKEEKFSDGKWSEVPRADRMRLTKSEAQVWIALYNLIMDPECRRKYTYNTHNRNELLKLRGYLHDVLLDQIPNLADLRRSLEELSVMSPPDPEPGVILEQVPELRENAIKVAAGKWLEIAKFQHKSVFAADDETMKAQAKALAATYNLDTLECLFPDAPKCAVCGQPATKRCSRCANEWYCRRQCQVDHWPKHKKACDVLCAAKEPAAGAKTATGSG